MRKLLNNTAVKSIAIMGAFTAFALTAAPAAAQVSAGVGIGPVGVGVNIGDHRGYWRDGYWHDYRDRVVVHDYDRDYYTYDTAYPYYYTRYDCGNPYSPYYDTDYCD